MKTSVRLRAACALTLGALLLSGCARSERSANLDELIRGERIAAHVEFLAGDLLEGRGVATRGGRLAADYIAAQFALAGAHPLGDDGSYFQSVPLVHVRSQRNTHLEWRAGRQRLSMYYLDEFVVVSHRQDAEVAIDAETVFVGHGITAPEFDWDDYKDADVQGKVVVLFTNEPASDDPSFFGGKALTYYGRWSYKYEEALRRGAAGVIIIHTTPTAGYSWDVVRNSWGGRNPYVKLEPGQEALAAAGWMTAETADRVVAEMGKTLDELLEFSETREFRPVALRWRLRGTVLSEVTPILTRNVVAVIEGSDPERKGEAVLYTAHWDHLGIDDQTGDNIYNGAVDNATGCGILIELAQAFGRAGRRPARSIIFAAVTAEEGGLRGSKYLADHSPVPAGKIAVNLNYDGLLPLGPTRDILLTGYERTTLAPLVEQTAREFGLEIRPEPHPEQGYYYRSDHFSLAKAGVPAFSLEPGVDYVGKAPEWGKQAQEDYVAHRYHLPADEFDPSWDFSGLAQAARFGYAVGRKAADAPDLPTWNEGDEFLPARERSWNK